MKKFILFILSAVFCILLISCTSTEPSPAITTGVDNSFVIHIGDEAVEAYDLPKIKDNGGGWGDPAIDENPYRGAYSTSVKWLERKIKSQQGAILRVKVTRLYQNEYYTNAICNGDEYCYADLTVEEIFSNHSNEKIKVGDQLTTKQHDAIIRNESGELSLYTYAGSAHLRPGFSYILFVEKIQQNSIVILQHWPTVVGAYELSSNDSYSAFQAHINSPREFLTPLAKEVYKKYAPEILR